MRVCASPEIALEISLEALCGPETAGGENRVSVRDLEDATLCARALAGNGSCWNELIRRHDRCVVVALLARGVGIELAQELAQEAWLRLIQQQRLGKLTRLQLPGLAIAQANYLALEARRREAAAKALVRTEEADSPDPRGDLESKMIAEQGLAAAQQVLSRCSESARRVFHLVYGPSALSHEDTARRLGLSLQRVRQILCEVRKEMREAIQGATDDL